MRLRRLDHVALRVTDPEAVASALLARLPFRVLEQSDEFILVGRSPDLGKVTLFEGPGPRERGSLVEIGIGIPCAAATTSMELDDGLRVALVPTGPDDEVELVHVGLAARDPEASARAWTRLGLARAGRVGAIERVELGRACIELHPQAPGTAERPLLDHVGLLVTSLEDVHRSVDDLGLEVTREVDAENSLALFVAGPDGVEVEYIEHKPSFATV